MAWVAGAFGAASLIAGFMGGRAQDKAMAKMAEKQHKFDMLTYNFNWQEAQDAYTYSKEAAAIAEFNLETQRKFKNQTAINQWVDKDKQRLFDYNNQVDAYNASVESYDQQLKFNTAASKLAINSYKRDYQDKITSFAYKNEELLLGQAQKIKEADLGKKQIAEGARSVKAQAAISRAKLKKNMNSLIADYRNKLEGNTLKSLDNTGRIRNLGQSGRSVDKNIVAQLAAAQRFEYALVEQQYNDLAEIELDLDGINEKLTATEKELSFKESGLIEDLYNTKKNVDLSRRQVADSLKSANLQYDIDVQMEKIDKYTMDLDAQQKLSPKPILAPQLSKPLSIEKPKLQQPRKPRKGPKPIKQAGYGGAHGLAGLASGFSSLASIKWN